MQTSTSFAAIHPSNPGTRTPFSEIWSNFVRHNNFIIAWDKDESTMLHWLDHWPQFRSYWLTIHFTSEDTGWTFWCSFDNYAGSKLTFRPSLTLGKLNSCIAWRSLTLRSLTLTMNHNTLLVYQVHPTAFFSGLSLLYHFLYCFYYHRAENAPVSLLSLLTKMYLLVKLYPKITYQVSIYNASDHYSLD